jgi:hypothetical protein
MKGVMPLLLFKGVKTEKKAEHSVERVNIPYAHARTIPNPIFADRVP